MCATLSAVEPGEMTLAARLAAIHERLDFPPGVMAGILRLPILDDITSELEALAVAAGPEALLREPGLVAEIERLVDLLAGSWIGAAAESQGRRLRLVELLRIVDGGRLPARAWDDGDAFGAELRAMTSTDEVLRETLGRLLPLVARATSVAPSAKWLADAGAALPPGELATARAADAIRRTLAALVRADIVSRPDLLVGGVRLINQRLARGLVWLATVVLDAPAETLAAVGLRMGTSGRSDAVVRDTALANTCAALLGASGDPGAAAALASMRVRVTNRNVLKQVDRALAVQADRAGVTVATLVELALPTFDLDADGRLEIPVGAATAMVRPRLDGDVELRWRAADGGVVVGSPPPEARGDPAGLADVAARTEAIEAAVAEERQRSETRLGSTRTWPEPMWRRRFIDHPIGGLFGRRLVWVVAGDDEPGSAGLPVDGGWVGVDGRPLPESPPPRNVRLWHPADATPDEVAGWRAELATRRIEQPVRQVDRETFRPEARDRELAADRRFSGRVVDHPRLRALLRGRGWAVPALGAWDQGDEATAWRAFDDELRAELRYQGVERVPTGERVERARLIAIRFVQSAEPPAAAAGRDVVSIPLAAVPPRAFSEAVRDVSLVVAVAELPGS